MLLPAAALFYNSLTPPEQEHIAQALTVELWNVTDDKIKKLMLEHLAKIDQELASQVAGKIGMQAPKGASATRLFATTMLPEYPKPIPSSTMSIPLSLCFSAQIHVPGSAEFGH